MNDIPKYLIFIWGKCVNGVENHTKEPFEIVEHGTKCDDDESLFLNAHLRFRDKVIVGTVKIVESLAAWTFWNSPHKAGVILVVTFKSDEIFLSFNGTQINSYVPYIQKNFTNQYNELLYLRTQKCGVVLTEMNGFEKEQLLTQLVIERLTDKCNNIASVYAETLGNWSDTSLAMMFDAVMISDKKSRKLYNTLIKSIGYYSIIKNIISGNYNEDIINVEALLFGTSGVLNAPQNGEIDDYTYTLRQRFETLKNRYNIKPMSSVGWQCSGLNRNNSIYLQLAQLAAIIVSTPTLHYALVEEHDLAKVSNIFKVKISDYWCDHDKFGIKSSSKHEIIFTKSKIELFIINFIVPYLFYHNTTSKSGCDDSKNDKLLELLSTTSDEDNGLVTPWRKYVTIDSAFRSQAVIQLKKKYCDTKNCYKCYLGRKILNKINLF